MSRFRQEVPQNLPGHSGFVFPSPFGKQLEVNTMPKMEKGVDTTVQDQDVGLETLTLLANWAGRALEGS